MCFVIHSNKYKKVKICVLGIRKFKIMTYKKTLFSSIFLSCLSLAALFSLNAVTPINPNRTALAAAAVSDTVAPVGSIIINGGAKYVKMRNFALSLSATDNAGVAGYYLSENNATPLAQGSGWVTVNPATTTYSGFISPYYPSSSLGDGVRTVYVWHKDAAGNVSSPASDSIILDTTAPVVTITIPTSNATYATAVGPVSLGGVVSDVTSGVRQVGWNNNWGNSGMATGTSNWFIPAIALRIGNNVITVTAIDRVGVIGKDIITVTYNPTVSSMPTVTTGNATNIALTSATLNGNVNPNGLGTAVWFEYGTTSGSYAYQSQKQEVIAGSGLTYISIPITGLSSRRAYYYRIAGKNTKGTSYGAENQFTTL